ncbi:hypothetical protein N7465_007951 [Penicillium sp. CMV-2018d]|nr:hypothetical protein N7465_007951 [Penicillium sp. CMV-2018d]
MIPVGSGQGFQVWERLVKQHEQTSTLCRVKGSSALLKQQLWISGGSSGYDPQSPAARSVAKLPTPHRNPAASHNRHPNIHIHRSVVKRPTDARNLLLPQPLAICNSTNSSAQNATEREEFLLVRNLSLLYDLMTKSTVPVLFIGPWTAGAADFSAAADVAMM